MYGATTVVFETGLATATVTAVAGTNNGTFVVPANALSGNVYVINNFGSSNSVPFNVLNQVTTCSFSLDTTHQMASGTSVSPYYSIDNGATWYPCPSNLLLAQTTSVMFRGVFNTNGQLLYCGMMMPDGSEPYLRQNGTAVTVNSTANTYPMTSATISFFTNLNGIP